MAPMNSQIGEKWKKRGKRRVNGKRRGDEVFPSSAEQMVESARRECRRPGLFIG